MKRLIVAVCLMLAIMLCGIASAPAKAAVSGLQPFTSETSAFSRILVYHQNTASQGDWQGKALGSGTCNCGRYLPSTYMGYRNASGGYNKCPNCGESLGWGCGIYSMAHAIQWAGGFAKNSSNGGAFLDEFIRVKNTPWSGNLYSNYASVVSAYGISTETVPSSEATLLTFFNNGGAIVTNIPGHYQVAVGIAVGNNGQTWIHMLDSTCYSTISRLNNRGYTAYNFSTGAAQGSNANFGGGEYWITYTAFQNAFSKIVALKGQRPYANLGDDFYAVVLNRNYWKPISESEGNDKITLQTETATPRQVWRFQRQNDGSYVISSCYDGHILEMDSGIRENGRQITAPHNDFWNGAYQKWYLLPYDNAYIIQSCHYVDENWVLDLRSNESYDGNAIQIYERNNTNAQLWSIYFENDVQLKGPELHVEVGNAMTNTKFTWNSTYGAKTYSLRIFKDALWEGEDYSLWESNSGSMSVLPAGNYYAYVDATNYYTYQMGNVVSFTVPDVYTIEYDVNGGIGTINQQFKVHGTQQALSNVVPTREGYIFLGWAKESTAKNPDYMPGSFYFEDRNVRLFAVWQQIEAYSLDVLPSDALFSKLSTQKEDLLLERMAYCSDHIRDYLTVEVTYTDGTVGTVDDYEVTTTIIHSEQDRLHYDFDFVVTYRGLKHTSSISLNVKPKPVFAEPDFVLPFALTVIDESAFEGIVAKVVYIPDSCTRIGKWAFRDCPNLTQIRIPANCTIGTDAFVGCNSVTIFGSKGSTAEAYASSHSNCTFVSE